MLSMESLVASIFALGSAVLLWPNQDISTSNVAATIITTFILGSLGIKLLKALVRPYISPLRKLPGPKGGHPLIGQFLNIAMAPGPNDVYVEWMRTWPDAPFIRHLSFGNSEVLLVNSLKAHKEVMQTKAYSFVKPAFFERLMGEFVGRGVLLSVGDEHRLQRRFLAGPFSAPNIRRLLPVFQEKARDLVSYIESNIEADTRGVIEIESALIKTTLDIVGVTILGMELDKLKSTSSTSLNFEECYHDIFGQKALGFAITFINGFVPLRWLPVSANRDFIRAKDTSLEIVRNLVDKRFANVEARRNRMVEGYKSVSRDLLTYMIEANLSGGEALSREQIVEDMLQFIVAGHETSAGSLTWTIYTLATNPDLQERLRKEIIDTPRKGGSSPGYAEIESMGFLNNVLRESLRLYSPSLLLPREAGEDMVIEGVHIPKGTTVTIIPAMVQRNRLIWGEDADEFRPDRWDNLNSEAASPYAISAFAGGPRVCVGRSFAYLEMKAVLVELLSKFVFEPVTRNPKLLNPALTLKPEGGLTVKVRRI